jgi:glycerol-3-phosphate dehydrogenase
MEPPATAPELRPAKGIHLVLPRERIPVTAGVVLPSVSRDRRSIFAVPAWGDRVVLGTTDTEFAGSLDAPAVAAEDVAYILKAANWSLGLELRAEDVVSAWAGLRPLRAGAGGPETPTADLSRKHHLSISRGGLVTITGGKLTTYRRMAADTVDLVCSRLGNGARARTKRLTIGLDRPLAGLEQETREIAARLSLGERVADHLVSHYGDRAPALLELVARSPDLGEPLCAGLPWIAAEAVWAVRHEMAVTLGDVLERRTRLSLADRRAGLDSRATALIAAERGWTPDGLTAEAAALEARVARERGPVAAPSESPESRGSVPLTPDAR